MAYLKEENKTRVQVGCFMVFLIIGVASLGIDVAINIFSAAENPLDGNDVDLGFAQLDQTIFSEFAKGGLGLLIFSFIAHLLINSIDGRDKLKMVNWPFQNVTNDLENFTINKGYSDFSKLATTYPDAFSSDNDPDARAKAWFEQIYNPVRDSSSVLGANKDFLYWREVFTFSVVLTFLYLGAFLLSIPLEWSFVKWPGLAAALICTLLLKTAARNASNTLVRNSLSEAAHKL